MGVISTPFSAAAAVVLLFLLLLLLVVVVVVVVGSERATPLFLRCTSRLPRLLSADAAAEGEAGAAMESGASAGCDGSCNMDAGEMTCMDPFLSK